MSIPTREMMLEKMIVEVLSKVEMEPWQRDIVNKLVVLPCMSAPGYKPLTVERMFEKLASISDGRGYPEDIKPIVEKVLKMGALFMLAHIADHYVPDGGNVPTALKAQMEALKP